jgi:hypothetical protein
MKKKFGSESGLFRPRVFLAFGLFSLAALLVILAATPPTTSVTVSSTIGQTVSVSWTGTIPPGSSPTSDCSALVDTPAADQENTAITVPAGLYNSAAAKFVFKITWTPVVSGSSSDEILTVIRASDGTKIGSSDGGSNTETVAGINLSSDTYKIIACGFSNAQPQPYTGTLTITTSAQEVTPPNYTTGAIKFGPATVADFQRTEGEPLLHIAKDGSYWETGPWGFSTTQSFMHRSTDGGDQFNVVSPTALRPNPPPGGGDSTTAVDDQGVVYFGDLEGAFEELDCSVSNDTGNTWRKNPACVQASGTDRQWLAVDNGSDHSLGMAGAADNTVFYSFHDLALGHLIFSSPGSTGVTDPVGGLVFTSAITGDPTGLFYSGGGNCGELTFDPLSRNLYYPCGASDHVDITVGHVNPSQRTGLTFTTHSLPPSPGGAVSNLFPLVAIDSAENVYLVWSDTGDHNLYYSYSTDHGTTWQPIVKVNAPPAKSNVFAWAEAGGPGKLVAIWLGNDSTILSDNMPNWATDPALAANFPWYGYVALISNANTPSPLIEQDRFTEKPMHYGQICNSGIGCTAQNPQGDRTMADFLSVDLAADGAIQVIFNDVTSQYHGAHLMLERQLTGPTALGTTLNKPTPGNPMFDPTGDAQVPHYSPAGAGANMPQLDFTSVAVNQPNNNTIRVTMTLNNLSSLLPPAGKTSAFWITRFQALSKNDAGTGEAYRIFYVGAESVGGTAPTFFAGSPTLNGPPGGCTQTTPGNCKVVQYPAEISVTGSVTGNTICIDLPTNAFGNTRPIGSTLYNVTAFSGGRNDAVSDVYTEGDSTRAFDYSLGANLKVPFSVVSRKVHPGAGTFDIDLPLTGPRAVEPRSGGANGNYTLVFSFGGPVTSCGSASIGTVSPGPNANQCTVNLTGIPNAQYVTVTLNPVSTACNSGSVSATMGVLLGDVNGTGVLTNADVSLVKAQVAAGGNVNASNFRNDVNVNGVITNADVSVVKGEVAAGKQLPSPP